MLEIVIDTETTGLDQTEGRRIVEIGAVELVNRSLTGETFHCYLCPQRVMPADAVAVHGLTGAFLADKPLFAAVDDEFLVFVGDAPLVGHNAGFDIAFLNAELKRIAKPVIATERVIDALVLARRKHPGGHNTLATPRSLRRQIVSKFPLYGLYFFILADGHRHLGLQLDEAVEALPYSFNRIGRRPHRSQNRDR
jgi:DNA polymerase III epsilon subunit